MSRTRLSEFPLNTSARIVAVDTPELQVALMNLGVLEGDICRIVNIAPLGDPIAIAIHGTKICIRKKDAHSIWVKP